jgi:ADP-ribose pyrophosphatase YjhB (NUDIX family)
MEKHFLGKVSLRAIIEKDGKVLLDRDVNDADVWEIPGGRLNEGEGLEDGLKREIFEELGVRIELGPIVYSEQFHQTSDGSLHLLLAYHATLADPDANFVLNPSEVAEMRWITKAQINDQKIYLNCLNALNVYWN